MSLCRTLALLSSMVSKPCTSAQGAQQLQPAGAGLRPGPRGAPDCEVGGPTVGCLNPKPLPRARTNFNQLELVCDLDREARLIVEVAAEGERSRDARNSQRRPSQARWQPYPDHYILCQKCAEHLAGPCGLWLPWCALGGYLYLASQEW